MLWDLILTSYTVNSLPVCCSTNKLLKTWLGKAKYFCICYNSKTKKKTSDKNTGPCFSITLKTTCKNSSAFAKIFFLPKSSLRMVLHSPLQFFGNSSCKIRHTMAFCLSFCWNFIGYFKLRLESDWLFCFTIPFSLAEKKMQFRAKNSAISAEQEK